MIDEANYGKAQLGKTKDGKQMSDDWIKDQNYKRIREQFPNDKAKANEVIEAFKKGEIDKVLSNVDEAANVTIKILK
ncbi:hypothetical protein ABIB40_004174 [Pedobacter sp. UYP30]|uniref:hypothetical protein n=1 Tax=Pedobacter sp. UYP30 TaxID=1756400 RepID=UPI0033907C67